MAVAVPIAISVAVGGCFPETEHAGVSEGVGESCLEGRMKMLWTLTWKALESIAMTATGRPHAIAASSSSSEKVAKLAAQSLMAYGRTSSWPCSRAPQV